MSIRSKVYQEGCSWSRVCLHLVLAFVATTILIAETGQLGAYHRAVSSASCFFIFPKSCTKADLGKCTGSFQSNIPSLQSFVCSLYTRVEALDALNQAIAKYNRLEQDSLAQFVPVISPFFPKTSCDYNYLVESKLLPALVVTTRDGGSAVYFLPLNNSVSLEALLTPQSIAKVQQVELKLPVLASARYSGDLVWDFRMRLLFTAQMSFDVTTSQSSRACKADIEVPDMSRELALLSTTFVLRIIGIIVSFVYVGILVMDAKSDWMLITYARSKLMSGNHFAAPSGLYSRIMSEERTIRPFESMPYRVVGRLLDGWRVLQAFSALSIAASFALSLFEVKGSLLSSAKSLLIGSSTALLFVSSLGFLRYNVRLSTASLVLWASFFKVFRIILSALPVGIGFLLMGMVAFGEVDNNLSSLSSAFFAFFAVINGDILWQSIDVTDNLTGLNFLGCIFIVSMYVLFAYVILRLLLAIVESVYWYHRLYTQAKLKRQAFRNETSLRAATSGKHKRALAARVGREHGADAVFLALTSASSTSSTSTTSTTSIPSP